MKPFRPFGLLPALTLPVCVLVCLPLKGDSNRPSAVAHIPVEEVRLANGLTLLLVPQPDSTTVAAGWMVQAGSADDVAGRTGLSHLLEHMMFKGSQTVGTRHLERELTALAEVDRLWLEKKSREAVLIDASPRKRSKLQSQLDTVSEQLRSAQATASSLAYLGQYSFLYSEQGGTGLNANTYRDLSLYYLTLPKEKLEIWFWIESDRLLNPVFREFYKEVQVVHEERRQRIESTPTGPLDEELRGLFWGDHPYAWDPLGHSQDLDRISRQDALEFFRRLYRTDRMTFVLVGGFDPQQVKDWANLYLARLPAPGNRGSRTSIFTPALRTEPVELNEVCHCPPQVKILYPTPRFGEPDTYTLQLLSAVLNGRTGRLYRSLVLDRQIAFSAFTQQISWRQAGEFSFRAESKGQADPAELVRAWDHQLDLLQVQPPTEEEIMRARNRTSADAFRSLKDPTALMKQLLIYQGLGDWRYINQWSGRMQEISSEDLVRVAQKYLRSQHRTVATFRRPQDSVSP